ncbi:MAG: hypothetical protein UW39_C0018G0003 [Parcubacteria group bacterium GW2011_GWC2_44_17]|nr:MAG: hypothetical protein UW39_C0018G0003 [Parcubacteria group bacterium GW2011_GWC2_44_17]HCA66800.1 hypothetical protein [Candidatus Jacksonbacteria bacterium]HCE86345.1 hypothetical protein [Candidatus Jacksonbacteria bacterium]
MSDSSKMEGSIDEGRLMRILPTNTTVEQQLVERLELPRREKVTDQLFWREGEPDTPESWMDCFFKMSPHIVTVLENPNSIDAQKEITQFDEWFRLELQMFAEQIIASDSTITIEQLKKNIVARAAEYIYFSDVLPNKKNLHDVSLELVTSSPNTERIRTSPATGVTLDHIYGYPNWIQKELDDFAGTIKDRSPIDFSDAKILENNNDLITELIHIATDIITLELPISEGTRERLDIVQQLLHEAIIVNREKGKKPVIISLGSGMGRGVLDVVKELQDYIKEAILIDFDQESVAKSQVKAQEYGVQSLCKFLPHDLSKVIGGKQILKDFLGSYGVVVDDGTSVIIECAGMDDYFSSRIRKNFNANIFSMFASHPESFYIVSHIGKAANGNSYPQQNVLESIFRWSKELKVQMYGASRGELIQTFSEASNKTLGQPSHVHLVAEKEDSKKIYHIFMFSNKEADISQIQNNPPLPSL